MKKKNDPQQTILDTEAQQVVETPTTPAEGLNEGKFHYVYARQSVERRVKRRRVATVLLIVTLVLFVVGLGAYAIMSVIERNNFRITVEDGGTPYLGLTENLDDPTSSALSTSGPEHMLDTTYSRINWTLIRNSEGGAINSKGSGYIASTFYLHNVYGTPFNYLENIAITSSTRNLDACIRILVITEKYTVETTTSGREIKDVSDWSNRIYAKPRSDGTPEQGTYEYNEVGEPTNPILYYGKRPDNSVPRESVVFETGLPNEYGREVVFCHPFASPENGIVMSDTKYPIMPNEIIKYTVVVWIEGSDPDTTNAVLNGNLNMIVSYSVDPDSIEE